MPVPHAEVGNIENRELSGSRPLNRLSVGRAELDVS